MTEKIYQIGKWRDTRACIECNHHLTYNEIYHAQEVCRYCGCISKFVGDKVFHSSKRFIRTEPLWKFWKWNNMGYWQVKSRLDENWDRDIVKITKYGKFL